MILTRARWFLWNVSANSHMTSVTKRNMLDPTGKVGDCSYTLHNHHPLGWIFLKGKNMSFFIFSIFSVSIACIKFWVLPYNYFSSSSIFNSRKSDIGYTVILTYHGIYWVKYILLKRNVSFHHLIVTCPSSSRVYQLGWQLPPLDQF